MNILSIGNSFSQDAQRWLHDIAKSNGDDILAVNLYIGGCSLEQHWENFLSGEEVYGYEQNGMHIKNCALINALQERPWDVVTFQQVSNLSGDYSSYQPYLHNLHTQVKKFCPDAVCYIHQTWAYEIDSTHGAFHLYKNSQQEMYERLKESYQEAASAINSAILPVADVIQYLRKNTSIFDYENAGLSLCRDGFHLTWDYGRYAAALTWYGVLFNKDVQKANFLPQLEGQDCDLTILRTIHSAVHTVLANRA